MKYLLVLILFCLPTAIAQTIGWTELKETNITVRNYNYDIFTNGSGNHIIVHEPNALKYYKMDVNGNTVIDLNPPLESSAVISPSISGNASIIYVVYRNSIETSIKIQYSLDGGLNWSTLIQVPLNSNASSIESVVSKDNLHVTYQVGSSVYHTYRPISGGNWTIPFNVSETHIASNPRIGVWNSGSEDKVYFTYNTTGNFLRMREYDLPGNTWSNVNWDILRCLTCFPLNIGFAVDDTYLYAFWLDNFLSDLLQWNVEEIGTGNSEGSGNSNGNTYVEKIFSTTTASNESYTAAWSTIPGFNSIVRMGFDGTASLLYDEIHWEAGLTPVNIVNLSSAGNDVHVIWKDNLSNNNLRYKYYDDIPLAPQNLAVQIYTEGNETYPKLAWSLNNEPDVFIKLNAYEIWRRTKMWSQEWSPWSLIGYKNGNQSEYIDYSIGGLYTEAYTAEYKIRAKDQNNHYSPYSSTVSINFSQFNKLSHSIVKNEYDLSQNYPNPFNPSTQITYALAQDAEVTVKIYDMLGTEVRELVNETQTAGNYDVNFDAKSAEGELSSGVYIYRITASVNGKILFSDAKQMLLMK